MNRICQSIIMIILLNLALFVTGCSSGKSTSSPSVSSINLTNGESNVSIRLNIRVQFDMAMESATINSNNVILKNSNGESIPLRISEDKESANVYVIRAISALDYLQNYSLTLTTGIKGLNGDSLASPDVVDFTTGSLESILHSFYGGDDGTNPASSLVFGNDGNLYGTTPYGGANGNGTVFKVNPTTGAETVVYSFGDAPDGAWPEAALVVGNDGNLYGTTAYGGDNDSGVVFKVNPTTGVETVVYSFGDALDGASPYASLIWGVDGNLYGTTVGGGDNDNGVVFKVNPTTGAETVVYSFGNAPDGASPEAALVVGSDGSLYGTTPHGGTNGNGTVFKVNPTTGVETVVHRFGGADGASPYASLIWGVDGNLYGTTSSGGANGNGTVFKVNPTAGAESVIYSFGYAPDGMGSYASLIWGIDGNLYGTTYHGGTNDSGVVFKVNPTTGVETLIYNFGNAPDGANSFAALVADSDGNLYGTTIHGGTNGFGTVFRINAIDNSESVIHSFIGSSDGYRTFANLIWGVDGNLYGTTVGGGVNGNGTVFKVNPTTGAETVVYGFENGLGGANPFAALVVGRDGNLYGTTAYGGINNNGVVFKVNPTTGAGTAVYSFGDAPDGATPLAALVVGNDGNLYGTTAFGGINDNGTVFKVNPTTGVETVIYRFGSAPDAASPNAALVVGSDGNLYGTTPHGGTNGNGTVFKVDLTTGVETVIYRFGNAPDGAKPYAALVIGIDGKLYGTTELGGSNGNGTVFKVDPTTSAETVVYSFGNAPDGASPEATLVFGSDGNLYGTTLIGGANDNGTVFKVDPTTDAESIVYDFGVLPDGATHPYSGLLFGPDGYLYGTTYTGGTYDLGAVFKLNI